MDLNNIFNKFPEVGTNGNFFYSSNEFQALINVGTDAAKIEKLKNFLKDVEGTNFDDFLKQISESPKMLKAWDALFETPILRKEKQWLKYVDDGVSIHGLKYSQSAISAKVVKAIPSTTLYQLTNDLDDLDDLYDLALIAKDELKIITNNIANNTNGIAGFRPDNINNGLKSRARAEEKIAADYGGDASRLVDISGSKIVYENLDDLYAALDNTFANYDIIKIKDRINNPLPSGYRDVLMNLRMPNGHIVEFRLHLKEIDEIADGIGHDLYEQVRTIEALIETTQNGIPNTSQLTEIQQLNSQMEQLYNDAYQIILSRQ